MLLKVLHSIYQQIQKTDSTGKQEWPQFLLILKKDSAKECINYCTTAFILHTSKVMLKILQVKSFNSRRTKNFQMS